MTTPRLQILVCDHHGDNAEALCRSLVEAGIESEHLNDLGSVRQALLAHQRNGIPYDCCCFVGNMADEAAVCLIKDLQALDVTFESVFAVDEAAPLRETIADHAIGHCIDMPVDPTALIEVARRAREHQDAGQEDMFPGNSETENADDSDTGSIHRYRSSRNIRRSIEGERQRGTSTRVARSAEDTHFDQVLVPCHSCQRTFIANKAPSGSFVSCSHCGAQVSMPDND